MNRKICLILSIFAVLTSLAECFAKVTAFTVQPLAPSFFGLYWNYKPCDSSYILYRKTKGNDYQEIVKLDSGCTEFVDFIETEFGQKVYYKLEEVDLLNQKVITKFETFSNASANLVIGGDFESIEPGTKEYADFSLSIPNPWKVSFVQNGTETKGQCMALTASGQSNVSSFDVYSPIYRINPSTVYTYSWYTTESLYGCAGGIGQAYGYTKDMSTSFYAKVPSLYIYMSERKDNWVQYWGQPKLPEDLYFTRIVLRAKGSYQPESVLIDDIEIIDNDIELLYEFDLTKLFAELKENATTSRLNRDTVDKLIEEALQAKQKMMAAHSSIDEFLSNRSNLCGCIRNIRRHLYLAGILKLKNNI